RYYSTFLSVLAPPVRTLVTLAAGLIQETGIPSAPIRLAHLAGQPAPSAVPLYRRLAADPRIDLTVFYGSSDGVAPYDDGYGRPIAWDADLTSGYRCVFLKAADRTPGLGDHFWATRNWE